MNVKLNDKITWKDKYGRILPGIVTSIGKYDDVAELELNGCVSIGVPTFLPISKEWNNVTIGPFQIMTIE